MTNNKSDKIILKADIRETFGKAVRQMRNKGMIPSNVYGSNFESKAITVDLKEFQTIYKQAGETGVIYIDVDGKSIPTLVTDIQFDPIKGSYLHVDFRKVDLNKKIEANVPFKFIGESLAVEQKNGVLITQMDEITVEALPSDIPHEIEIDLAKLAEIGDEIKVSDLATATGYVVMEEPDRVIISVTEHKEENIEPETVTEAPEITSEKPEDGAEEGGEGEAPAPEPEEKK